ncbi:hypothetical protein [Terrisporobacter vanillatitrophus]|uniref:hypothetical protein n=1 Tax=Terrisporobacter vanillatitrophus TaxID=3058402 RepID=UPI0033693A8D
MYSSVSFNRHKVTNALAQEDPTYENYLRLAEAIFTGRIKVVDLQDKEEETKRMKEIDDMRARGEKTPYEAAEKKPKRITNTKGPKKIMVEVTNLETNEKNIYKSMKNFCEVNEISYSYIKSRFKKAKSNKILYNRLIINKLETDTGEVEVQPQRVYLNPNIDINKHKTPWVDEEKAFVAQNRPDKTWKYIGACLGRSAESCSNVLRHMKNKGQLEYYLNLYISDKLEIGA